MSLAEYIARANAALIKRHGICFITDENTSWLGDSGADESDLARYQADGDTPEQIAAFWGDKYGLDSVFGDFDSMASDYLAKALSALEVAA
ncbi:hypothetical protein BAJUN_01890 [Bajunvirus bajun]|uniref:Uncharacterized protein n=1 Tax=Brevundimonas phage vB_BgoS-Bajun TaxID=2948594 RepID=A0A9E7N7I9_9CAUD|nr:hypothetical protein BAJUN_01890 [Brevundimonas phage vB_BgoS-Bajun]